jgi:DNA-binding transcriptional MerR regulator
MSDVGQGVVTQLMGSVVRAFSLDQTERLTGVSRAQLLYWDRTHFFSPSLTDDDRRAPNSRIYSFRDIACLKVLNTIRNEIRVSLPHLREVKEKLAHLGDDLWAKTTLYVLNRKIEFDHCAHKEEVVTGQAVLQIPLRVVTADIEKAVQSLWRRDPATIGKVARRRGVASSQPVIAGARIPIRAIKAFKRLAIPSTRFASNTPRLLKRTFGPLWASMKRRLECQISPPAVG